MSLTPSRRDLIIEALTQAADYFSNRADVTADGDSPNEEMSLQQLCEEAIECFSYEEVKDWALRTAKDRIPPLLKHATTPESEALAGRLQPPPEYEYEDRYEAQFLPPRPRDDIPF